MLFFCSLLILVYVLKCVYNPVLENILRILLILHLRDPEHGHILLRPYASLRFCKCISFNVYIVPLQPADSFIAS